MVPVLLQAAGVATGCLKVGPWFAVSRCFLRPALDTDEKGELQTV